MKGTDLQELIKELQTFVAEREWGQFHDPKNAAIALSIETAELLEQFRYVPEQNLDQHVLDHRQEISDEVGDILYNLLIFSNATNIDPIKAARDKLTKTAAKYPVATAKGVAKKYQRT